MWNHVNTWAFDVNQTLILRRPFQLHCCLVQVADIVDFFGSPRRELTAATIRASISQPWWTRKWSSQSRRKLSNWNLWNLKLAQNWFFFFREMCGFRINFPTTSERAHVALRSVVSVSEAAAGRWSQSANQRSRREWTCSRNIVTLIPESLKASENLSIEYK